MQRNPSNRDGAAPIAAEELGSCRTVYTLSKLPRAKPCLTSHTWQAWNSWHAFLMQARSPGHLAQKRLGPNGRIWVPPRNPSNRNVAAPIAAEVLGSCRTVYTFPRLSRGPIRRIRVPPLTRLITSLPQHSRPLRWGHPGLFTRLGNSREDRKAEFHQYSANLRNCPVPSSERQKPHRPTPPGNPVTVQRDPGPSALDSLVQSQRCPSIRGRFPGVIPDCLHASETHARTDRRSFTNTARTSGTARSLHRSARNLTGQPHPKTL